MKRNVGYYITEIYRADKRMLTVKTEKPIDLDKLIDDLLLRRLLVFKG